MSRALFIAGLPFNMSERDVQRVLEGFGHVSSITLIRDKATGKSRGYCFAEMKEESAARAALQQLNGALVGGRKVYVDPARPKRFSETLPRQDWRLAFVVLALLAAAGLARAALGPEPSSAPIAQMVAKMLEQGHYAHHPIGDDASRQMLRNFIEFFDYNHMVLEQADVDRFEKLYATTLDDRIKIGDVSPAFVVFDKIKGRMEQRVAFVKEVVASSPTFTADETYPLDRSKAPWPADAAEAEDLWRRRVKFELLSELLNGSTLQTKTVGARYDQALRTFREYDSADVVQTYLNALSHTFDPHTEYMAPAEAENFNIAMRLSLVGIGAVLRSDEGYPKIVSLVPGGPAETDKRLKPNDRIEAVAQGDAPWVECMGMSLEKVVQMIRGTKGTTVRLRVIPADAIDPGTRVVIALVRDEVKLTEQEAKAKVLTEPGSEGKAVRVGLITLPSFYSDSRGGADAKSTTRDVVKLLAKLKQEKVDGLILDLRRNGGGALKEAVNLTGLFIPRGPVVQVKDGRGQTQVLEDFDAGVTYDGPMVVLTSRGSASASEILAGAMQDYGRAVVVGDKSTFGKGTVQAVVDLAQYLPLGSSVKPGELRLTVQKFYRVSGASTQNRGVIPDIRLPSLADEGDFAESSQKNALLYDEVAPVPHRRLDSIAPSVSALQQVSGARVGRSRGFAHIREDIERFKKSREEKVVSLNEKKRRQEKKADEERERARKKERIASKELAFTESPEITVAVAEGKAAPKAIPTPTPTPAPQPSPAAKAGPGEDGAEDYEKAPPGPDMGLQESVNIIADMVDGAIAQAEPAALHR